MSKFQLWSRDEYGQGSIIMTSEDVDEVIKRAKKEVTDINVNNALTVTDRERNWEAYYIDISASGKSKTKYIYGSTDVHVKNRVYSMTSKETKSIVLEDIPKSVVRMYLGNISTKTGVEEPWFAKDVKGNIIDKVDHPDLLSRTFFFVKMV
jgi:hypothetical protein